MQQSTRHVHIDDILLLPLSQAIWPDIRLEESCMQWNLRQQNTIPSLVQPLQNVVIGWPRSHSTVNARLKPHSSHVDDISHMIMIVEIHSRSVSLVAGPFHMQIGIHINTIVRVFCRHQLAYFLLTCTLLYQLRQVLAEK